MQAPTGKALTPKMKAKPGPRKRWRKERTLAVVREPVRGQEVEVLGPTFLSCQFFPDVSRGRSKQDETAGTAGTGQ